MSHCTASCSLPGAEIRLRSLRRCSRSTFGATPARISQPRNAALEPHATPLSGALCGHHALRYPPQTLPCLILTRFRPRHWGRATQSFFQAREGSKSSPGVTLIRISCGVSSINERTPGLIIGLSSIGACNGVAQVLVPSFLRTCIGAFSSPRRGVCAMVIFPRSGHP